MAIKTVRKYGLFGIAFLTPIFFSIPIGTFIALRFFPNKKKTLPVLAASVFGWSFVAFCFLTNFKHEIKHIFFDLDRTLWDFETNAYNTLSELYEEHALRQKGISDVDVFIDIYKIHNEQLWELYRNGKVEKDVLRFKSF